MKKYNLLLPIAGKAQRFIDAGYTMPKALILAKNKHVIDWAMDSIDTKYCNLIFMVRVDHVYNFSIDKILKQKFGEDITIVKLDKVTRGALETCTLAREHIDNDLPLIVYIYVYIYSQYYIYNSFLRICNYFVSKYINIYVQPVFTCICINNLKQWVVVHRKTEVIKKLYHNLL